jgi:hypothetical protein
MRGTGSAPTPAHRLASACREPLRRLDTSHDRVGSGPGRGDVVIPDRLPRLPDRLAKLVHHPHRHAGLDRRRTERTLGRDIPFPGRLELHGLRHPSLGRRNQRAVHRRQVAARFQERRFQPRDHRGRRRIAGKMARELGRDMRRGRWVDGKIGEHRLCLRLPRRGIELAHHGAIAGLMNVVEEQERARARIVLDARTGTAADACDRPAGHRPRELGDVGLDVAAADAERVQLHDLAREILVQPGAAPGLPHRERTVRADRHRLVEIQQHRRMPLDRVQHVGERAEHMRADRLELHRPGERHHLELLGRDREMIRPEMHEALDERCLAGERGHRPRRDRRAVIVATLLADDLSRFLSCGRAWIDRPRRHGGLSHAGGCNARRHGCGAHRAGHRWHGNRGFPVHAERGFRRARAELRPDRLFLCVIGDETCRNARRGRRARDDGRPCLEPFALRQHPLRRIADDSITRPCAEAEPIERDTGSRHDISPSRSSVRGNCRGSMSPAALVACRGRSSLQLMQSRRIGLQLQLMLHRNISLA